MKLSVIVPMYNAEKHLDECLRSLALQTIDELQVLMVNDGSTDCTGLIAKSYASKYPDRMIYLEKDNGGISDARNYGLPYVTGEYLTFLDSDDIIEVDAYQKMVDELDRTQDDIMIADIDCFFDDMPSKNYVMHGLTQWPINDIQKRAMLSPLFAWNKVYRTKFWKELGLRFPKGTWYEDLQISLELFLTTDRIGYLNEVFYHYRQHEASIMHATSNPHLKDIFTVMASIRQLYEEKGVYDKYYQELEYLHTEHLRLYGMYRFIRSDSWKECYFMSSTIMDSCFPKWKKNQYIQYLGKNEQLFLKYYCYATAWLFHTKIR